MISNTPPLSLSDLESFDPRAPQGQGERRFLCPLCGDSKPSDAAHRCLTLNSGSGAWNCKRCGAKGKLRDKWEERPLLNQRARSRAALLRDFALSDPQPTPQTATALTWRDSLVGAVELPGTPGAAYLERNRSIIAEVLPIVARGCLFHSSLYGRPAVMFPFRDRLGELVAIQARFIDDKPRGHLALGPKSAGAFFTDSRVWDSPVIVLTEAPIDALSLAACGVPAVALGGTECPHWLLMACGLKSVVLAFDNDENRAGDKAASKLSLVLQSYGARVAQLKPIRKIEEKKADWNDMLLRHGIATFSDWLYVRLFNIARLNFDIMPPCDWWSFAWFGDPVPR
jgi:hypothetical protein